MKHLLTLADLSIEEINAILDDAQGFCDGTLKCDLSGRIAANLFFESSTRTQYSFNVAQEKLNVRVVSFNVATSSMNKKESFYDTVKLFDAIGCDFLVIRSPEVEYYKQLLGHVNAAILNAGDGTGNHPTQSLLDLLTIRQEFGKFEGLKCCICGDIAHSRVAHTNFEVMRRLGMEVVTSGPDMFMEEGMNFEPFETALKTSDIVMMLRVQHERHDGSVQFDKDEYHKNFGLTAENVAKMKENAIIMHPAPFNRGVEIADDVVECDKARIFKQMSNGVFVRMAVLKRAVED
ncbi:MAG: aspartate carbamoyltransferase catalytic subunit [Ruminococcaceae bacterium]|nr:aspartate carbamoyltransferase catalytic subunit [Oscillospiraceae bacterium]